MALRVIDELPRLGGGLKRDIKLPPYERNKTAFLQRFNISTVPSWFTRLTRKLYKGMTTREIEKLWRQSFKNYLKKVSKTKGTMSYLDMKEELANALTKLLKYYKE